MVAWGVAETRPVPAASLSGHTVLSETGRRVSTFSIPLHQVQAGVSGGDRG